MERGIRKKTWSQVKETVTKVRSQLLLAIASNTNFDTKKLAEGKDTVANS